MRPLRSLTFAAVSVALALVAGDALAAYRIPLTEAHRQAITSSRTVANLAQGGVSGSHRRIEEPGGLFKSSPGVALAVFAGIVNERRAAEARKQAAKVREALGPFDARLRMEAALARALGTVAPFQGTRLEVTRGSALAAGGDAAAKADADVVLVVDFRFGFSPELDHLVVSANVILVPTGAAAHPALRKAFGTGEQPVTRLYRALLMASMTAPGEGDEDPVDRWLPDGAAPARRAIEGGIDEIARMLVWDLDQGGPSTTGLFSSYAVPREKRTRLLQFGEEFEAAPVRTQGDRVWYRSQEGELVSVGETYPGVELTPMSAFAGPEAAAPAAVP